MKFIVFTLAFVCLAQNGFGAPSQASTADTPNLETLMNNFNIAMRKCTKNTFGEEAIKNLKETSNQIACGVQKFIDEVAKKSKELEPEAKEAVKKFQDSINEQLCKFKKENPEVVANAEKIQQKLETFVRKVVDEFKNLEKSLKYNSRYIIADLDKLARDTICNAIAQAKELQAKLSEKKP